MVFLHIPTSEERYKFLAQAGKLLASSLDYHATLKSVARLAVPFLADICVVDILINEQELERVAIAHFDLKFEAWIVKNHRPNPRFDGGVWSVCRMCKSCCG